MRTTSIPPAATIRLRRPQRTSWYAPRTRRTGRHPPPTAPWSSVLARLHALTGKDQYRTRAEQVLEAFSGEARRNPAVHAALLSAYGILAEPLQVVVIGDPDDPDLADLRLAALGAPVPDPIVLTVSPGAELAAHIRQLARA